MCAPDLVGLGQLHSSGAVGAHARDRSRSPRDRRTPRPTLRAQAGKRSA